MSFGCKINKINGNELNEFLINSNNIFLNNKHELTYFRDYNGYNEVLVLVIISINFFSNVEK